jgi:hypothetical protein
MYIYFNLKKKSKELVKINKNPLAQIKSVFKTIPEKKKTEREWTRRATQPLQAQIIRN